MASGDSLLTWNALHTEFMEADFATLDNILTTSADEPDDVIPVLDFDSATNEFAVFANIMPAHYAGTTGVTVTIIWTAEATTGNVKWDVAFKRMADATSILSATYAAIQSTTTGTDGTARAINTTVITFTDGAEIDSVATGEYFRMAVERDAADGGDTMNSDDAELISVHLTET
jgi:hypothetical protein